MAIQLTLSNMLELFSVMSPLLLSFFLVMSSLFNQNIKGLVYLAGVLIASVINVFVMNIIGSPQFVDRAYSCNVLELPSVISAFNSPSPNSVFIAFTIAYLVLPMYFNNQMNYIILAALLSLFGLDAMTQVTKRCTTMAGTFFGALLGFLLGATWFTLFYQAGYSSLLYFDELQSNNVVCSRPANQTFKCSVYKGGQLISSNVV